MKSIFLKLIVLVVVVSLGSCMGKQNKAPSKGMNLDSERIYGKKGGEPRQLPTKYPADEDGSVAERVAEIRTKLYPVTQTTEAPTTATEVETPAEEEGNN